MVVDNVGLNEIDILKEKEKTLRDELNELKAKLANRIESSGSKFNADDIRDIGKFLKSIRLFLK